MSLACGTRLGPYEVLAPLGAGGMGEVYRARDPRLGREVALKLITTEGASSPDRLRRFETEARAVASLSHPNVVTVHDVGSQDGRPYLVLELVEGETLRESLRAQPPTLRQAVNWALEIARGLAAAHERGIVHRDLKPENVVLTEDGRVKILDFGLARLHDPLVRDDVERERPTETRETQSGMVLGTVGYMSPEQVRGEKADARSDVFALGTVLYEMAAGRRAFKGSSTGEILASILRDEPPALKSSSPAVPPGLEAVVRRCLAKRPAGRFPSAREAMGALEAVAASLSPGRTSETRPLEPRGPYPGLSSFTEKDSGSFFGRETEVEALWRKLESRKLLALIGPSGAGKTSFVRAGLVPSRPEGWAAIVATPGAAPMKGLARALAPEVAGDVEAVQELLRFDEADVAFSMLERWRQGHREALVVVDQFEELFTVNAPETQARFAELLGRLTSEADVHVLVSLRDDFLIRCHEQEALASVFAADLTPLLPLSGEALRRALVEPAKNEGFRFEDDSLVQEMLESVEGARAALPLLAFAVSRLWEKRDRDQRVLTRAAYEEIGGVAGALAQHAEETLARIGSAREGIVREILRNLVTSQWTRAVSEREELLSVFSDRAAAAQVLGALIDARLLTSYEVAAPAGSGQATQHRIEIVHESLLKAWPRLVRWQAQDEEGSVLRDQLRQAARLWEEKDRSPDLLWTGTAHEEYRLWRKRYSGGLTATEEAFAGAMAARARRRTRLRTAGVASVVLALAGVVIAIDAARQEAVESARRAEASRVLALAELRLDEDPTEALAYTIASLEVADSREARVFAMKALWRAPPAFEVGSSRSAQQVSFSPDGRWLAASGFSPEAGVWAETGERIATLPGHRGSDRSVNWARWGPGGLLVTGEEPTTRLHVWAIPEGRRVRTIELEGEAWWHIRGDRLYAQGPDPRSARPGMVRLRSQPLLDGDAEDLGSVDWTALGASSSDFSPGGDGWLYATGADLRALSLPWAPGGRNLLLTRHDADIGFFFTVARLGTVFSFDREGGVRQLSFPDPGPPQVASIARPETSLFSGVPDGSGRWFHMVEAAESMVRVWSRAAWPAARPLALRRAGSWNAAASTMDPTGDWLVVSTGFLSHLTFWPLRRTYPAVVDGYSWFARPLAFSPDSRWLATSWPGGELRLWAVGEGMEEGPRRLDLPDRGGRTALAFGPKGRNVFVVGIGAAYVVPVDGSPARPLEGSADENRSYTVAVSPGGRRVATASFFGEGEKTLRVWDLDTGERRVFSLPAREGTSGEGSTSEPTMVAGGVPTVAFQDDSTLYTGGDGGIRRWDLDHGTHELVVAAQGEAIPCIRLDAEGRSALVGYRSSRPTDCSPVEVVDISAGTTRRLPAFGDCVEWRALALDPSGTVAATGDRDGLIRVGRLDGGQPHLLAGPSRPVQYLAISPDLRWVASTSEDDTLRLWPMPDLDRPPLHTLPHDELLAKLRGLTNLRVVQDPESSTEYRIEHGPFPGWKDVPTW